MNPHRTLERLVKETFEAEPSRAQRDAVWATILARISEGEASGRGPNLSVARRPPRRAPLPHPAAVGVAAGAVILAVLALLPTPDEPGKQPPTPHQLARPLPTGSRAEAAAVLNAAAASTRSALPAVMPGE